MGIKFEELVADIKKNKLIIFYLLHCPVILVPIVILFIIGEFFDLNSFHPYYAFMVFLGIATLAPILYIILNFFEKPFLYLGKYLLNAVLWLFSCMVLIESQFSLSLIFKIIIAFEYIFLGCLYPDFIEKIGEYKNKIADSQLQPATDSKNNPEAKD